MNISDYLKKNAKNFPQKTAFICGEQSVTFLDLYISVESLSSMLIKKGVKRGDQISVIQNNSIELLYLFYAIANIGAVIIPINGSQNKIDLLKQLKLCDTKYLFIWHGYLQDIKEDLNKIKIKKIFTIGEKLTGFENFKNLLINTGEFKKRSIKDNNGNYIFSLTSGSTNNPKIIIFSQKTKILRALNAQKLFRLNKKDILIIGTPFKQSITQRIIFLSLILGSTCVIMQKFTPKNWVQLVTNHNVTFSILVSSQIENISEYLRKAKKKLKNLKTLVSCCAQLRRDTIKKILPNLYGKFFDTYGATEAGTLTKIQVTLKKNIENMGKNLEESKFIFYNNDTKKFSKKKGEICVKTPLIFSGYYKNKKISKSSFLNNYFKTGDYGYLKNKNLFLTGRRSDVIITGGINVYSRDIERVIDKHPDVDQSVAIGVPDKKLGEAIIAVIKTKKKISRRKLHIFCANNLADYQQPFYIDFISKFPTTGGYNKISKIKLKLKYSKFNLRKKFKDTFS